jgi:hypothetical protein
VDDLNHERATAKEHSPMPEPTVRLNSAELDRCFTHPTKANITSVSVFRTYSWNYGVSMICLVLALATSGCANGIRNLAVADGGTPGTKTFQVASYGTKGDGIADDGPAIERAMVAAAANSGGGQVVFPCGQFSIQSANGNAPGSRSLLYLKNAASVQLVGQGHCSHVFTSLAQKSVLEFEDSTGASVTSLYITALNAPYVETYGMDGGAAIRFTGVTNGNISEVEVDGSSAGALYLTKGTSSTSVANNSVHDTYGSAIWEDDCSSANAQNCAPSTPSKNNIYQSNTFTNTSLDAGSAILIDDGNGSSNAKIQNNTVSWTKKPIAGNPGIHCIQVNNASYVSVLTNSCTGTPWDGIVVTTGATGKSVGVTIQGNTIQNSGTGINGGSGIVVYDDPKGLGISSFAITSNTITTAADDGIRLMAASKAGNVQQAQVENNTISLADQRSPGSRFGIDIENSASITATANGISCNGKCIAAGVYVSASTATNPTATSNQVTNILGNPLVIR